jgi:hypothetical protein
VVAVTATAKVSAPCEGEDLQCSMDVENSSVRHQAVIVRRRECTPTAAATTPCKGDDWKSNMAVRGHTDSGGDHTVGDDWQSRLAFERGDDRTV